MIYPILLVVTLGAVRAHSLVCPNIPPNPCYSGQLYQYSNGSASAINFYTSCSCRSRACSTNWRRPPNTLKVKLLSDVAIVTQRYMFCERIASFSLPLCTPNDIALVTRQSTMNGIDAWNCRCPDSNPMILHYSEYGREYGVFDYFKCDSHKTLCPGEHAVCSTRNESGIYYNCECPDRTWCNTYESGYGECLSMS